MPEPRRFSGFCPVALLPIKQLWLAAAAFILLTIAPLLAIISDPAAINELSLEVNSRTLQLLQTTLIFSSISTLLALLLSLPAAIILWQESFASLRLCLVFLLLIPPYLYAQGFSALAANPPPGLAFLANADGTGWAALICGVAMTPLTTLILSLLPYFIASARIESARLTLSRAEIARYLLLPAAIPLALAATALTFIYSLLEGGLPLSLQTTVFATELVTKFLAGSTASEILFAIWPLPLLVLVAAFLTRPFLARFDPAQQLNRRAELFRLFEQSPPLRLLIGAGAIFTFCCTAAPVLGLVRQALSRGDSLSMASDGSALIWSLVTAFFCGTICTTIALRAAPALDRKMLLLFSLILTAAIPPSLIGIAWAMLGTHLPMIPSAVIMVLAHCSRALPLTTLVAFFCWKTFSRRRQLESACLLPSHLLLRLRLEAPIALISFCVAAVISLRELEVSLLTVPPGGQTLPLRVYSLMHYGAGADVARLSLLLAAGLALGATIVVKRWPND